MQYIGSAEGDPVARTLLYHSCLPYTPAYVHLLPDTLTEFLTDGGSLTFDTSSSDHDPQADHPWHHGVVSHSIIWQKTSSDLTWEVIPI